MADLPPQSNPTPPSPAKSGVGRRSSRGIRGVSKPPKPKARTVDWNCSREDLEALGMKPNMSYAEIGRIFADYFNIPTKPGDDTAAGPSTPGDG